jgi:DNA repair protein RecO (recombination protein O)
MSRIKKTLGFVLRAINYGDTSRILTVLTSDAGKISFIAKGARRPKSPFAASLELLTLAEFVYYDKEGLKILSQASIVDPNSLLLRDYDRLETALNSSRWIHRLLEDDHEEPAAFHLYKDFLDVLKSADDDFVAYELSFKLKMLAGMGLAPMLDKCLSCGKDPNRCWFSLDKGGILCENCRVGGDAPERPVPLGSARGLHTLLKFPFDKVDRLKMTPDVLIFGGKLIGEFTSHHLRPMVDRYRDRTESNSQ